MKHVLDTLQAYVDGELSSAQAAAVERHCAHCPRCARVLRETRQLWDLVDTAVQVEPTDHLWSDLRRRLPATGPNVGGWAHNLAAGGTLAAGLLLGIWIGGADRSADQNLADLSSGDEVTLIEDSAYFVEDAVPTLDRLWLTVGDQEGDAGS